MPFSLSGSTITQSGTDIDLSGLSSVAGVTVTQFASAGNTGFVGVIQRRIVNIPSPLVLQITGNLTLNPNTDCLITNTAGTTATTTAIQVMSGGVFTYGASHTGNSLTGYTTQCGLINTFVGTNGFGFQWCRVMAGGSMVINGGVIETRSTSLDVEADGALTVNQVTIFGLHTISAYAIRTKAATQAQADKVVLQNVTFDAGVSTQLQLVFGAAIPPTIQVALRTGVYRDESAIETPVTFNNYSMANNRANQDIVGQTISTTAYHPIRLINYDKAQIVVGRNGGGNNGVLIEGRRVIQVGFLLNDAPVDGVTYFRESDNGSRTSMSALWDYTATTTTIQATTSGLTPAMNVLTQVIWAKTNNPVGAPASGQVFRDLRYNTNHTITIHNWVYGGRYDTTTTSYIGLNTLSISRVLFPDTFVTLSETNAVAKLASSFNVNSGSNSIAVTSASTLDDLYDSLKAWKTRPIQAQLEYPSISTQPITAEANTATTSMTITGAQFLTSGTKIRRINANLTASGAVSNLEIGGNLDQNTPTNLSNVVVTGTLTYNTNSNVTVTFTDCTIGTIRNNGTGIVTINRVGSTSISVYTDPEINFIDSSLVAIGITSATIYSSASNRDQNINPGPTFTSTLNFKFGSVQNGVTLSGTVFLRVTVGPVILLTETTLTVGTNTLDLGVQGQLSILGSKIDDRPTLTQIESSSVLAKESTAKLAAALSA